VQFSCALDQEAFRGCISPLTRAGIPDGRHTFYVIAIKDHERQQVPSYWTWTVDTTPPAAVASPKDSVSYRRLDLTWTPSADTDHVVIFRFTSEKQVTGVPVYTGAAAPVTTSASSTTAATTATRSSATTRRGTHRPAVPCSSFVRRRSCRARARARS
jgi:hypothetical protein